MSLFGKYSKSKMSSPAKTVVIRNAKETGDVDVNNLVPFLGLCCVFLSFYTDWPECIGAVTESTCCCLSIKHVMCKPAVEDTSYCKFCLFDCDCDPMTSCCSVRNTQHFFQFESIFSSSALPFSFC